MKIQSRWKDYYDYISHQFGQDPSCVYVRGRITSSAGRVSTYASTGDWKPLGGEFRGTLRIPAPGHHLRDREQRARDLAQLNGHSMEFIIVGKQVYTFLRRGNSTARLGPANEHLLHEDFLSKGRRYPTLPSGDRLTALVRGVGAPVFRVLAGTTFHEMEIDDKVPVLADYGFPAILPAAQAWQAIYSTLTNVLRKNPDKEPPVVLANDDRIHAAGFDLKTSFRNPVNPKPKKSDGRR